MRPRRGRALNLTHVLGIGNYPGDGLVDFGGLFIGGNVHLDERGATVGENVGGHTKGPVDFHGLGVAFRDFPQQVRVCQVFPEAGHIDTGIGNGFLHHFHLSQAAAVFVAQLEQGHEEGLEGLFALPLGGQTCAVGQQGIVGAVQNPGLLPELDLFALVVAVNLLEGEGLPVHVYFLAGGFAYLRQPHGSVVHVGSTKIVIGLEIGFSHFGTSSSIERILAHCAICANMDMRRHTGLGSQHPQAELPLPYAIILAAMNSSPDDLRSTSCVLPSIEEIVGSYYRPLLNGLKELAQTYSLSVYFVGGPVRDWLTGRSIRDLDFVVESDAMSLARELAQLVNGGVTVHNQFGTATVELDGVRIDLVTARREVYSVPGALPSVEPSSLNDDLGRRDFTINAMALPLDGDKDKLLDPHGGRYDLEDGLVRTIHSLSFRDDPTRLFRAVRYEQRFGFEMAEKTFSQLRHGIEEKNCDTVSGDRLRHELELFFREQRPDKALARATELGLLSSIAPDLGQGEGVVRWAAVGDAVPLGARCNWLPWLAALAYPLSPANGESLVRRLNMPRRWAEVVRSSIVLRNLESKISDHDLPLSALFGLLEGHKAKTIRVVSMITDSPVTARNLERFLEGCEVRPSLKGDDLLEMGVPVGPMVGKALAELRDMRLDGRVNSEEEERQWVKLLVASRESGRCS